MRPRHTVRTVALPNNRFARPPISMVSPMGDEIPKRLTPDKPTTGILFLKSGNRCAYPGCDQPLLGSDSVLVGEIAHIEAAMPDGPRFNDNMTNEQRRFESNLVLMCGTHHSVIDGDLDTWTVQALQSLKAKHEAIYTGAVDRLRAQLGDVTEGTTWTMPTTLSAIFGTEDRTEELPFDLAVLERFATRLAQLPIGARSLLAMVVTRGESRRALGPRDAEFRIRWSLLRSIVSSNEHLDDYLDILDHAKLAWFDEPFDGDPLHVEAGRSTEEIGWPLLQDIKTASGGDPSYVRQVLVDLDFAALDQTPALRGRA